MKHFIKIFWILLLFPFYIFAQPSPAAVTDLIGVWQGSINTVEKKLPYEIAIAEKDGKLMAFARTSFTVNNEEIVSVKKMKITVGKERIIISDDDMLFNNFNDEAAKKIQQTNTLSLGRDGLQLTLTGTFETRASRVLRPATGDVYLIKKEDQAEIKLMVKLEELKLIDGLSFSPKKQLQITTAPAPQVPVKTEEAIVPEEAVLASIKAMPMRDEQRIVYTGSKNKVNMVTTVKRPASTAFTAIENTKPATPIATTEPAVVKPTVVPKSPPQPPIVAKQPVVVKTTVGPNSTAPKTVKKTPTATAAKPPSVIVASTPAAKPIRKNIAVAPAIDLADRKIEIIDQLSIASDSLVLTLYDNGTVDGDSVSIILNGKTIVSQQLLSTIPFTKTIYITPELGDTIQLVMYAENLGSLPPNTGLLILQFDNKRNEIRFSGDLNKNAAITLRRKAKN